MKMKTIAVYCGSNAGISPAFRKWAWQAGKFLAESGIRLVYGGGRVGLMGAVADGALEFGGEVIGVIPHFLNTRELAHTGVTELVSVHSMHERKAKMAELSDGFIGLPGGYGTLDELFEILTWSQLGLHPHPCGLLNVEGYFDHLIQFLDGMNRQGFLRTEDRGRLLDSARLGDLLERMEAWSAPVGLKWDDPVILAEAQGASGGA